MQQSIGLGVGGGELGHELGRRDSDRAGDPLLVGHPGAQPLADQHRVSQSAPGTADVEKGFVEGQRFDQRGDHCEQGHDRLGDLDVGVHVAGHDDRLGAQPSRPGHGHRAAYAVATGLVGCRGDYTPVTGSADDDRKTGEFGTAPHLDAGEKGVHVDVQDPGVRRRCRRSSRWTSHSMLLPDRDSRPAGDLDFIVMLLEQVFDIAMLAA